MMQTKATAGIAWMISATVLYTAANLCVKSLAHFRRRNWYSCVPATSLILAGSWLLWKGKSLLGVNRKWLLIRGIFGTIGFATFFHTIRFIPLASATVIQYLSPIFTVLLARALMASAACGPCNGFLWIGLSRGLMVKGFDPRISWLYLGLGITSAICAAVAYLATMKCRDTDHPVGVVIWFHLVAVPVTGTWTAFTWVRP